MANRLSDNEFSGNGVEDLITPEGDVAGDFAQYVGAEPGDCSSL